MSRAARLLALLECLRAHRRPVTAASLAADLGRSQRTIYRDIATLQAQGAAIEGEAGLGYILRDGYFLPPLNFTQEEAEALLLGLDLVRARGGHALATAAHLARGKIRSVLPHEDPSEPAIGAASTPSHAPGRIDLLRDAVRAEEKLRIAYLDAQGQASERIVWPIQIGLFNRVEVLAAWCEARADFRHFRLDRIGAVEQLAERMPRRRRALLTEWRRIECIGNPT